jgi:hypothetical protein
MNYCAPMAMLNPAQAIALLRKMQDALGEAAMAGEEYLAMDFGITALYLIQNRPKLLKDACDYRRADAVDVTVNEAAKKKP